jgi:hypothetical protein
LGADGDDLLPPLFRPDSLVVVTARELASAHSRELDGVPPMLEKAKKATSPKRKSTKTASTAKKSTGKATRQPSRAKMEGAVWPSRGGRGLIAKRNITIL